MGVDLPKDTDALVLLTVEELAVNELREPFHHWVRTIRLPVKKGGLGAALPYVPPTDDGRSEYTARDDANLRDRAREIWEEIEHDVPGELARYAKALNTNVTDVLSVRGKTALQEEKKRYEGRLKEVETAMAANTLAKLEKERDRTIAELRQRQLFEDRTRELEQKLADLTDELARRRTHYEELLSFLKRDQDRVLQHMLPRRYQLRGTVQVFPVAVEVRLPFDLRRG